MNKFTKPSAISFIGLSLALSVFILSSAVEGFAQSPSPTPARQQVRDAMHEGMMEIREMRREGMDAMRDARDESVDKMREVREDLQSRIDAKREELRTRLQRIKDERKRQVVERIDKGLDALNKRVTDHFMAVLDKLEDVLVRIGERVERSIEQGIDMSAVDASIVAAQEAIRVARAAVEEQAAKTYVITVNTEAGLRSDVGKARQALHADLRVLFEIVKTAKNAVHEAARAFAGAHGRDLPTPISTSSPQATP